MLDRLTLEGMRAAAGQGPILVALSGGGDSVALLHLLAERFGAARLRAVIVDHKLREGSSADARKAAGIAADAHIEPRILELAWPRGANRGHDAARALRYGALCIAARDAGARVIGAGHTRDDQAETVFLRGARGSGLRGLSGMRALASVPKWPEGRGLVLARPLLGARRGDLRDYLRTLGVRWIEDPANRDAAFARVRARGALAQLDRQGLDPMRLAALAERLAPYVTAIDKQAAALIERAASFAEDRIVLERARWQGPAVVRERALDALLVAASGEARGPGRAPLKRLIAALGGSDFSGATLAGAWLHPQRDRDRIVLERDPGALAGRAGGSPAEPLALEPGVETVWDGRLALTVAEPGWAVALDRTAPVLQRGEERRPLAAGSPHWLLRTRVQHVLGTHCPPENR